MNNNCSLELRWVSRPYFIFILGLHLSTIPSPAVPQIASRLIEQHSLYRNEFWQQPKKK